MNIIKELALNFLIKFPFIRKLAKLNHQTGLSARQNEIDGWYKYLSSSSELLGKAVLELGPGKTIDLIVKAKNDGASSVSIVDIERYLSFNDCERLGIDYRIYDGKILPFNECEFDYLWSKSVFEHIRYPEITVEECYRILKPGGIAVHHIDLVDHFYYSNTQNVELMFNCLKYSERIWNLMTWNRSNYVNRKRVSHWIDLHRKAGFQILDMDLTKSAEIESLVQNGNLKYLEKYSIEDATTTTLNIKVTKPL